VTALPPPRNRVYARSCPDCGLPPRQPCRSGNGKPHPRRVALAATELVAAVAEVALLLGDEPGDWDDRGWDPEWLR
jgi:hypothetical protein